VQVDRVAEARLQLLRRAAGQASRETLARKMASTVDTNAELERTYLPNVASVVRLADEARNRGREVLRAGVKRNGSGT
jgi:hypothetical protein